MSETFRSKVAHILQCNIGNPARAEDEICAAYKERAEGMPLIDDGLSQIDCFECDAIVTQREACKKYMLEGLE